MYEASLRHRDSTKIQSVSTNGRLSQEPPPTYEESKECCICTKRPKTPNDYLCELIQIAEMDPPADSPQCDLIHSNEMIGPKKSPQHRLRPPPNTPEAVLFERKEPTEDIDPGYRERAERREREYRDLCSGRLSLREYRDHLISGIGSSFWDIVETGASLLEKVYVQYSK